MDFLRAGRLVRGKMGTDELYRTLIRKLDILDRLIEAEETSRRAWCDRLLKGLIPLTSVRNKVD